MFTYRAAYVCHLIREKKLKSRWNLLFQKLYLLNNKVPC